MKAYMLAKLSLWEALQERKVLLSGTHQRQHKDCVFCRSYEWMRDQMCRRLPGYPAAAAPQRSLWWAWAIIDGVEGKAPDLADEWWHWGKVGNPWVVLELQLDPSRVLLSDSSEWGAVLNEWPLSSCKDSDENEEAIEQELDMWWNIKHSKIFSDEDYLDRVKTTWPDIFDPELSAWKDVQATFEELRLADVLSAQIFYNELGSEEDEYCDEDPF